MKIPDFVYNDFNSFDKNKNGVIEQHEIDALKGTKTIFDTSSYHFFKVKDGMDISLFIKENRLSYDAVVQYTENEYTEGRKILKNNELVSVKKNRRRCKDDNNSVQVEQGEFAVRTYSKETPSLQTYNVCNCVAVTIYDKSAKRGFITHIDTVDRADSFEKVLKKCKFNPETSEVRIIGGQTKRSEGIVEIIDETLKKFKLQVVEYDVLGDGRRDILLDLNTGEVFDYKESKPTYDMAFEEGSSRLYLMPNSKSE